MEAERLQEMMARGEAVDGDMLVRINSEARRALAEIRSKAVPNRSAGDGQAPGSYPRYLTDKYGVDVDGER